MKRTFTILASIAIAISLSVSCTDLSEIEKRIDSVENQLEALQTQVSQLNNNADLLQALKDAKTIKEIKKENGVTTIILSNGDKYEIPDGANGEPGSTPQLTIDDKGYWSVSYDGTTWTKLENKATPEFSMKDGYWMVRYSKNDEFTQLLDPSGNPIAVTGGGGIAFDWEVVDGVFRMTLPDPDGGEDRIVELPIVGNEFSVTFDTNSLSPVEGQENIYQIEEGVELAVPVTIKGLVSNQFEITAPAGWTVALDDNDDTDNETFKLLVTGHNVATKAIVGSTATDVVLKIFSDTYGTAMDKIRFELVGSIVATPAISKVEFVGTENNVLKFNVDFRSATGYKYLLYAEGATAPAVETLKAADSSTEKILNLTEYTDGTEKKPLEIFGKYTLYVLAYADGDVYEETATPKSATGLFDDPSITGLYREYLLGNDITIAGKVYNKATYGEAVLLEKGASIATAYNGTSILTKVFFVNENATFDYTGAVKYMVIISNNPAKRSKLTVNQQIKLNQGDAGDKGEFVLSGIDFDSSPVDNYPLAQNQNGKFDYVLFQNCHIKTKETKSLSYISSAARSYNYFAIADSEYEMQSKDNIIISVGTSTATYGTISITNSIVYNTTENSIDGFRIFNGDKATIEKVIFNNNTLINLHSSQSSSSALGAIMVGTLTEMECSKNLIFTNKKLQNHNLLLKATNNPTDGSKVVDNITYKGGDLNTTYNSQICFGGKGKLPNSEEAKLLEVDPFDGGTYDIENCRFIPAEAYKSYGAQR